MMKHFIDLTEETGGGKQETRITSLATSGNINLKINKVYNQTPIGDITFVLPNIKDNTKYYQIVIQVYMANPVNYNFGTTYFVNGTQPDISNFQYFNILYEYDSVKQSWCCGVVNKGDVV